MVFGYFIKKKYENQHLCDRMADYRFMFVFTVGLRTTEKNVCIMVLTELKCLH
jgi:hypothetical protein